MECALSARGADEGPRIGGVRGSRGETGTTGLFDVPGAIPGLGLLCVLRASLQLCKPEGARGLRSVRYLLARTQTCALPLGLALTVMLTSISLWFSFFLRTSMDPTTRSPGAATTRGNKWKDCWPQ